MLRFPPGFDMSLLFHDYLTISLPFITASGLIVAFLLLKSAVNEISRP